MWPSRLRRCELRGQWSASAISPPRASLHRSAQRHDSHHHSSFALHCPYQADSAQLRFVVASHLVLHSLILGGYVQDPAPPKLFTRCCISLAHPCQIDQHPLHFSLERHAVPLARLALLPQHQSSPKAPGRNPISSIGCWHPWSSEGNWSRLLAVGGRRLLE